ncbi:MAG: AAA family ATPase, partial [Caulobacterales bacterium]|nr:AAA family ATPase [Caulobacterales bacterium]
MTDNADDDPRALRARFRPTALGAPDATRAARRLHGPELYRTVEPGALAFADTSALDPLDTPPGQERAVEALELGLALGAESSNASNIFVLAPPGFGKLTIMERYLADRAARAPVPDDWVYVYNFDDPRRPKALNLPAGRGCTLKDALEALLDELRAAIPAAFEGGEFEARRDAAASFVKARRDKGFERVNEEARARGLTLMQTPTGVAITPVRDGKPVPAEEAHQWSEADRERLKADTEAIESLLQELMKTIPKWEREARLAVKAAAKTVTERAVRDLIQEAEDRFSDLPDVIAHLRALETDAVRNANAFLEMHARTEKAGLSNESVDLPPFFARYSANLVIDNCGRAGAPVVFEDDPTFPNLFGAVEYRTEMGNLVSDFTLVKPGAAHAARGGFLLVQARKLLANPYAYEALKRTLRAGEIKIRSLGQIVGTVSAASLEPQPIPLEVKVLLMGDRSLYYMLSAADPEFDQLFPIAADFSEDVARTADSEHGAARLAA